MEKKKQIMKMGEICDHCMGRQFKGKFPKTDPEKIGAAVRMAEKESEIENFLDRALEFNETKNCYICEGLFDKVKNILTVLDDKVKENDFETFSIGTVVPKKIQSNEEELWTKIGGQEVEPIKRELNRIIGRYMLKITGKKRDFDHPDIIFLIDLLKHRILVQINPMFVYGKYQKLQRGIPQTKWPCRECRGRGCEKCKGTGKQYDETIEELIAGPFLKATQGTGEKFHGHGREDLDAKMLGEGRPFVLEIIEPKIRKIELKKIEKEVNKQCKGKIKISGLKTSSKLEVQEIKRQKFDKTYKCIIETENEISKEEIKKLNKAFTNTEISQKTPKRVLEHRADRLRKRVIKSVKTKLIDSKHFSAEIVAEGGTYIKELINGDEGRTRPSLTSELNNKCKCVELDVTEIHGREKDD